jgi:hypothetical protein
VDFSASRATGDHAEFEHHPSPLSKLADSRRRFGAMCRLCPRTRRTRSWSSSWRTRAYARLR